MKELLETAFAKGYRTKRAVVDEHAAFEIQKWLREEHNIHIWVVTYEDSLNNFNYDFQIVSKLAYKNDDEDRYYETWNDALLEALKQAIKLLNYDLN